MEIYKYTSTDPKQTTCDLGVTFSFDEGTDLATAEAYVTSLLVNAGAEVDITFDMWTTPQEDEEL
tara:strand:- start:693 stop:887 length:195 start_codon:yes stop_codon:yes gene_type:complete